MFAQNDKGKADDEARIVLTPYIDAELGFNAQVAKLLLNKMNQILSKQGLGGMPGQRFIITANIDVLGEDVIVTTKEMYQLELGINFVTTAMRNLEILSDECKARGVQLIMSHVNEQPMKVITKAGFYDKLGKENFCPHIDDALARAESVVSIKHG